MELYPDRIYSKPEFTALPPYLFSGADFALIPSRDEPFGLVAVEFGRKGALGVGSRLGGLGLMPGWVSRLSYNVFGGLTDHLVSGSLSSPHRRNTCCPSSRRRSRKLSSLLRRSVSCSVLDRPSNVSPSSSGANALKTSTRGVSTQAVSSPGLTLGRRRMEIQVGCYRSSTLEIGLRLSRQTRLGRLGIRRASRVLVCAVRTPAKRTSPPDNLSLHRPTSRTGIRSLRICPQTLLTATLSLPNNNTTHSWRGPTDNSLSRISTLQTRSWIKVEPR